MKNKLPKLAWFFPAKFSRRASRRRQQPAPPGHVHEKSAVLLLLAFLTIFAVIAGRAILIQIFPLYSDNLSPIADRQYNQQIELAPYRGAIYDRRREPIAISTRLPSLFVNPRIFHPTPDDVNKLATILRMDKKKIRGIANKKNYFSWLARKVPKHTAQQALSLNIKGLDAINEPNRFYPAGSSASNLIGAVGLDDTGLLGIERYFEKYLRGDPIKMHLFKDARGQLIFKESTQAAPEKPGHNIHLTIDRAIQDIAEEALIKGVRTAQAKSGFAIVSDPHTGRILAVANYPTFNPNDIQKLDMKRTTNKALMDGFEPGSVTKTFIIAEAIEQRKTTPDTLYDCEDGVYQVGGVTFRDSHKPPARLMTTTQTLVHSSNVCIFKIAETLGKQRLYDGLKKYGIGGGTVSLGFAGEARGYISNPDNWRPIRFANIAFGQGFMTNGFELVQAFGAIANGGNLMQPYLVSKIESASGSTIISHSSQIERRVMTPETAKTMRRILQKVVDDGAKAAAMDDYTAGGKTGTAEKVDPATRAYSSTKRLASFAGIAPISDPHLVVYVAIDEPGKRPYYGALWAAPVFKEITEQTLRYLNVAPDKVKESPAKDSPMKRVATGQSDEQRSTTIH